MSIPTAERRDRYADHAAGLVYLEPLGPALPGLTAEGLAYVRDDLLARAASAERQADAAWEERNLGLVQRCGGVATACREAARQIVLYSMTPPWSVTE